MVLALAVSLLVITSLCSTPGTTSSAVSPNGRHLPLSVPRAGAPTDLRVAAGSGWVSPPGMDPYTVSLAWLESTDSCFGGYSIQYLNPAYGNWQGVTYGLSPKNQTSYWATNIRSGTNEWELIDIPCSGPDTYYFANFTQPPVSGLTCVVAASTSIACSWSNPARYGGLLHFDSYVLFEEHTPVGGTTTIFPVTTITDEAGMSYLVQGLTPGDTYGFFLNTTDACAGSWVCTGAGSGDTSTSTSIVNPFVLPTGGASSSPSGAPPETSWILGAIAVLVLIAASIFVIVIRSRGRRPPERGGALHPSGTSVPSSGAPPGGDLRAN